MRILFFLFIFLLLFISCASETPPQIIDGSGLHANELRADDFAICDAPRAMPVLHRQEGVGFSMYEPPEGTYIGAWLMPELTIRAFEELTGKNHAVYVNEMNLGDEIPVEWILHCIAARATPLIIVYPPEEHGLPKPELVLELAERLGSFNLPMFVVFFPGGDTTGMMPAEYTLLFRRARQIFNAHAPMVAFVWGAPCYSATTQNPYYPGHNVVDWVALPLFSYWQAETGFDDILARFEQFYLTFAPHKPIMILPLGISHFTRGDYTYRVEEAAEKINHVYAQLANFPRLGLIVYGDAFMLGQTNTDDFSVTGDIALLQAYATAVANFLPSINRETGHNTRFARVQHPGYYFENEIYISHYTLENEWGISPPRQSQTINGANFAPSRRISAKRITVCHDAQVIFVENRP